MPKIVKCKRRRRPGEPRPAQPRPDNYIPSPSEFMRHANLASDPHLSAHEIHRRCTEEYPNRTGYVPRNPRERKGYRTMGNEEFEWKLKRARGIRAKKDGEGDEKDGTEEGGDSGHDTEDDETGRRFGAKVTRAEATVAVQRKLKDGTWEGKKSYRDLDERARTRERRAREPEKREEASRPVQQPASSVLATSELSAIGLSTAETARTATAAIPPPRLDLLQALIGLSSAGWAPTVSANPPVSFGNAPPQSGQRMLYPAPTNPDGPSAVVVPRAAAPRVIAGNQQRRPAAPRSFPMAPPPRPAQRGPEGARPRTDTVLGYSQQWSAMPPPALVNSYGLDPPMSMEQVTVAAYNGGMMRPPSAPPAQGQSQHLHAQEAQTVPEQQQASPQMACCRQETCRHRSGDGGVMLGPDPH